MAPGELHGPVAARWLRFVLMNPSGVRYRRLESAHTLASGARSIIASVTEADYEYAIDCHRANAKVVLTGDLEYSGGRCRLLKPRIVT